MGHSGGSRKANTQRSCLQRKKIVQNHMPVGIDDTMMGMCVCVLVHVCINILKFSG